MAGKSNFWVPTEVIKGPFSVPVFYFVFFLAAPKSRRLDMP